MKDSRGKFGGRSKKFMKNPRERPSKERPTLIRSSQTLTVGPAHVLEQFGADAVLQRAALSVDLVSTGLIVGL